MQERKLYLEVEGLRLAGPDGYAQPQGDRVFEFYLLQDGQRVAARLEVDVARVILGLLVVRYRGAPLARSVHVQQTGTGILITFLLWGSGSHQDIAVQVRVGGVVIAGVTMHVIPKPSLTGHQLDWDQQQAQQQQQAQLQPVQAPPPPPVQPPPPPPPVVQPQLWDDDLVAELHHHALIQPQLVDGPAAAMPPQALEPIEVLAAVELDPLVLEAAGLGLAAVESPLDQAFELPLDQAFELPLDLEAVLALEWEAAVFPLDLQPLLAEPQVAEVPEWLLDTPNPHDLAWL